MKMHINHKHIKTHTQHSDVRLKRSAIETYSIKMFAYENYVYQINIRLWFIFGISTTVGAKMCAAYGFTGKSRCGIERKKSREKYQVIFIFQFHCIRGICKSKWKNMASSWRMISCYRFSLLFFSLLFPIEIAIGGGGSGGGGTACLKQGDLSG